MLVRLQLMRMRRGAECSALLSLNPSALSLKFTDFIFNVFKKVSVVFKKHCIFFVASLADFIHLLSASSQWRGPLPPNSHLALPLITLTWAPAAATLASFLFAETSSGALARCHAVSKTRADEKK